MGMINRFQNQEKELLAQLEEAQELAKKAIRERDAALGKLKQHEDLIDKAEKASKMKSLFLANMSHEIRTPLNAIEGFARIMAETDSPEERMNFLEIIESNNNRLQSLINEILDLSRVEAGELSIKKSDTDLRQLCRNVGLSFKFKCNEMVKIRCHQPNEQIILNTDPNRLTQVLSNLISNAIKHTKKGSIEFGYRLLNNNEKIEFFVSDTGDGIAKEDLDTIFLTYVSKDAETNKNGHGLGLALCKIIIEKMKGTISVKSELGKGSTFSFILPFEGSITETSEKHESAANSRTLRVTLRPQNKHSKTILVVEDEESNYQLVKNILGRSYRLLRANNGIEAVTIFDEEHPDLILMDIRMPEMNGLDATRIIKEIDHDTPIIALSAFAFEENIAEAKAAGCDDFLSKPFKVEALIDLTEKYLKEKH